jgi:hypothetical protein
MAVGRGGGDGAGCRVQMEGRREGSSAFVLCLSCPRHYTPAFISTTLCIFLLRQRFSAATMFPMRERGFVKFFSTTIWAFRPSNLPKAVFSGPSPSQDLDNTFQTFAVSLRKVDFQFRTTALQLEFNSVSKYHRYESFFTLNTDMRATLILTAISI